MSGYPGIRASDEDRSRAAAALGEHYAAGRLTLEEFQERLDKVYAATTLGELDRLMADLPGTGNWRSARAAGPGRVRHAWQTAWRFARDQRLAFVIWLLGGADALIMWVAVPLDLVMLRLGAWAGTAYGRPGGP